jgi:Domain of unknown function (DUF1707)
MAAGSGIRIGDADREATAASLREHFAHGRLTIEEFQQRLDAAFAAKTDLDLAKITSDLPHAPAQPGPWPPRHATPRSRSAGSGSSRTTGQGSWRLRSRAWAIVNMAILVIAMILIVDLFRPFRWLEHFLPRPVLVLVAILVFLGQALRRAIRGGGWPLRPRGRGRRF